jgi:hypothetical protein
METQKRQGSSVKEKDEETETMKSSIAKMDSEAGLLRG